MMQEIEMENIYEEPQCMREINRDTNRAGNTKYTHTHIYIYIYIYIDLKL